MMRHTRTQHRPASQQVNDHGRVSGTHRPGGRCGWVQCRAMRRRRQRNSVSGVTSHPARVGRGSAAAIAASRLRSVSVSSGRSTCRRSTVSWWRNTMISRSLERPERTVSRASDARNRYKIRYTRTQHRPASRQVNDHGRVSGTHRGEVAADIRSLASAHQTTDVHLLLRCPYPIALLLGRTLNTLTIHLYQWEDCPKGDSGHGPRYIPSVVLRSGAGGSPVHAVTAPPLVTGS